MNKSGKNHVKHRLALIVLFIIGVTLSVFGYILRGTVNTPADHATEGLGVLIGLLSGIVLFAWFCLVVASFLRKTYNDK